jgi:hypothetical protein
MQKPPTYVWVHCRDENDIDQKRGNSPMRYRFIPGSIRGVHNLNLKLYQDI